MSGDPRDPRLAWVAGATPGERLATWEGLPVVPLNAWYAARQRGGTRETYASHNAHFIAHLLAAGLPWDAPADRMARIVVAYLRDALGLHATPAPSGDGVLLVPGRETRLRVSTIRVRQAAMKDLYEVLIELGLYAHANPLALPSLRRGARRARADIRNAGLASAGSGQT